MVEWSAMAFFARVSVELRTGDTRIIIHSYSNSGLSTSRSVELLVGIVV